MSNSTAADAVNVQGAAKLKTDCVIAVGGVQATAGLTQTKCTAAITQAPSVADPYGGVAAPAVPSGGVKNTPNNPKAPYTLSPGRYNGMDIKGDATLDPGVYYVNGDFNVNSNTTVTGSGVTIYVTGSGRVTLNGNATVNLTAPTSGTYSGILFFGDRTSSGGSRNKFNGTATSKMTGAIYFASQDIDYLGNFSGLNGCTHVIGKTVEWTGNTTVSVNCSSYGMTDIPAYTLVRLVE
jgi:hypothetical protein